MCPPQAVINERQFSVLGRIATKYRPRLQDETIEMIAFLNHQYNDC